MFLLRYALHILTFVLAGILFIIILPARGKQVQEHSAWKGNFSDGAPITKEDLSGIIQAHEKWIRTYKKEGQQANLSYADLSGADLAGANFKDAYLTSANLTASNLSGANLQQANLQRAKLSGANLSRANLRYSNLQNTDLIRADLTKADLRNANLSEANLKQAKLHGAKLSEVHLCSADLSGISLAGAKLIGAKLPNADIRRVNLRGADLSSADLSGANLSGANLTDANLKGANLRDANLSSADLTRANLNSALVERVDLSEADLSFVVFEPKLRSIPNIQSIATAKSLSSLVFEQWPQALVALRAAFKQVGLRTQEREITYALKKTERVKLWSAEDIFSKGESLFNLVLFEVTCEYGMSPGRTLLILGALILFFSLLYMIVLKTGGQDGIWKVWPADRIRKDKGEKEPIRLLTNNWGMLWIGLYFSLLSAFHIGWRDFNVGNWITRMQLNEYTLRATGWVRFISGLQSLISVYLLALLVLSYFGRPFG